MRDRSLEESLLWVGKVKSLSASVREPVRRSSWLRHRRVKRGRSANVVGYPGITPSARAWVEASWDPVPSDAMTGNLR
jgi:hypothetical protein